jgi:four helix bundle protein
MNFRKLDVYQYAVRFLPLAAAIADSLPPRYAALGDQLRRASLSIPLNIAEGSGKSTGPDQRRFYSMARGSAMECAAILDACRALARLPHSQWQNPLFMRYYALFASLLGVSHFLQTRH